MRVVRNTLKPLLAALVVGAVALALGACGREEPDLSNGKALFVQKCGSCHQLSRAGTQGQTGPSLDAAFRAALQDGFNRETVEGVVKDQIANVRSGQRDAGQSGHGVGRERRGRLRGLSPPASPARTPARSRRPAWRAPPAESRSSPPPAAAGCHRFSKAGTNGNMGPSLDELASAAGERARESAEEYVHSRSWTRTPYTVSGFQSGVMPTYEGRLSEKQVQALSEYLLGGQ